MPGKYVVLVRDANEESCAKNISPIEHRLNIIPVGEEGLVHYDFFYLLYALINNLTDSIYTSGS